MQKGQLAANAVGLGLRREHLSVLANENIPLDFIELAPENWIGIDGARATMRQLEIPGDFLSRFLAEEPRALDSH